MTLLVVLAAFAPVNHARNRRRRTHRSRALALTVTLALLVLGAGPGRAAGDSESEATAPPPWAVILSPGPTEGVLWGGYHITITGYSAQHACLLQAPDCETVLREHYRTLFRGQPWHLHGRLPPLEPWHGMWTQTLDSDLLDTSLPS